MYPKRIINKVPGNVPPESVKEKQGYIGDLASKTIPQLKELLERQIKLLSNKAFISNLPDKGEKSLRLKEAVEKELELRNEAEQLARKFVGLSLTERNDVDALEWTGRCAPGHVVREEDTNLSDDEQDPLKILATHSGAGFHKKKHKVMKAEESLIKPSDLVVDETNKGTEGEVLEEYAKELCEKFDSVKPKSGAKSKFFPFRTLIPSKSEKKEPRKSQVQWEMTAATPPLPVHGDTKMVSLHESIHLQCEQQQKLKEIQTMHAMERLTGWSGGTLSQPLHMPGTYRDHGSGSSSDDEQSEHEVFDEEYPDGGGVVIYNLVDDINN